MRKLRTILALAVTLPLYLGSLTSVRHPFTAEWESYAKGLFGR